MRNNHQEEIFIVVDRSDRVIGYEPRSICHQKRLLHRTVAVIVFNDKGEVLLQKRSMNVDTNPGLYTLSATGHVSQGETYLEAAKKELLEELGIKSKLLKFETKIVKDFPHYEMQSFYSTYSNGPFKFPKKDIEKLEFIPISKLPDFFSKSTATIRILYNDILKRGKNAMKATAIAPSNIAFTKYWGRKDETLRLPANGSISMCLSNLLTTTTVEFSDKYSKDEVILNGKTPKDIEIERVIKHLDRVRKLAKISQKAKVSSNNNFPIAVGLSSAASGFAALTLAASNAAGLNLSRRELSILARQASGSACRSIPSGFVEWLDGNTSEMSYAEEIFPPDWWKIVDVVAIVSTTRKEVPTSVGHQSAQSSPFLQLRISRMKEKNNKVKKLIKQKNLSKLGKLIEQEALELHTIMLTQNPPLIYWTPGTLTIMKLVSRWRAEGLPVYFTINTGQNIHLIAEAKNAQKVKAKLKELDFVKDIIVNTPGEGARLSQNHLF
ncbi:diphosphomevalonate decarboxylase [Candidatus Daviesbacteria bacterium]|nr:diphosphomevalonate decarboxylase [Candidatus Daviesbacteria bacterium]